VPRPRTGLAALTALTASLLLVACGFGEDHGKYARGEVDMVRDGDEITFEMRLDGEEPYPGSVVLDDIADL
jgi:hypothetical protein